MPEENQTNTPETTEQNQAAVMQDVAAKISEAHNILVALSSDPSVDDLSAAIGLSLYLDKLGKRATAIYSGTTPNALEFLNPGDTFETTADTLQDFVIALNKDKADHLRYKLDGDYVKIYITPYKSRIDEADLEFTYGDFNIDLVLALDVANGTDLDSALREHGRIMHDATVVNVTTANPGKFGEIEWSDPRASSVSEMIASLLYQMNAKTPLAPEEATAFLTGIIAATDRFSAGNTTSDTMKTASRLMESGANQQLITENISDLENQLFSFADTAAKKDPTALDIDHQAEGEETAQEVEVDPSAEAAPAPVPETAPELAAPAPAVAPEPAIASEPATAAPEVSAEPTPAVEAPEVKAEKVLTPATDFVAEVSSEGNNKYGQMLEDALAEAAETPLSTPLSSAPGLAPEDAPADELSSLAFAANPAASSAPAAPSVPEINGVPEINYGTVSPDDILPPPPAPPIDLNNPLPEMPAAPVADAPAPAPETSAAPVMVPVEPIAPAMPAPKEPTPEPENLGPNPAMQDQVYAPQVSNPGAFQIPGNPS